MEAKERVKIKEENQTLATITLQNYFRMYDKLGGMTGTASTEAGEFAHTYGLEVVSIPTNRSMVRLDEPDLIYKTEAAKFEAAANDIAERNDNGQPVLVGTISVEKSEQLSRLLEKRGITHEVLNAKQHEREAHIVTQAGRLGAVTVATNMAGRGVDILLGGNPEGLAEQRAARQRHHDRGVAREVRGAGRRSSRPSAPRTAPRCASSAVSTCSAPSVTRAAASTTSCAGAPAARATRARAASTCRSKTSSCASSPPAR